MDEKDVRILCAISKEKTASPEKIGDETDIPTSTVHYRISQLRERGIIKNELLEINLEKCGLELTLISEIWAQYQEEYQERVGEKLAELEGVNQVYFAMGDTDFIAIAHLTDREMVERLLEDYEAIDEITRTSSRYIISTVKNEPNALRSFEPSTLIDALCE